MFLLELISAQFSRFSKRREARRGERGPEAGDNGDHRGGEAVRGDDEGVEREQPDDGAQHHRRGAHLESGALPDPSDARHLPHLHEPHPLQFDDRHVQV